MKNIKITYVGFIAILTGLWFWTNPDIFQVESFIGLRNFIVQYLGTISIGIMSLIMPLATRPVWLEKPLGGLDKIYRLHKWLGITVLVTSTMHWLWSVGPKWASGLGLIAGKRGPRPDHSDFGVIQAAFASQRGFAENLGEWAFYGAALLMVLALVKWFPYHWFAKTHTILAGLYLVLVFHGLMLFDFASWSQPIGYLMAAMLLVGTVSAVIVLTGKIGKNRQATGKIEALEYLPQMKSLEIVIRPDDHWTGHKAGQFAFVTFPGNDGAHPFTISSAWQRDTPQLTLISKALGDYTQTLPKALKEGDPVRLEGPYGTFTFDEGRPRQIWISGGIGLTPFLARLEQLGQNPTEQQIDFYQAAPVCDETLMVRLEALARKAGVKLHVWRDGRDGFLSGEKLRQDVPDWKSASVWFCGPSGFGDAVKRDLIGAGLPAHAYHQELFSFR